MILITPMLLLFAAVPALYFQEGGSSFGSQLVTDGNDSQAGLPCLHVASYFLRGALL